MRPKYYTREFPEENGKLFVTTYLRVPNYMLYFIELVFCLAPAVSGKYGAAPRAASMRVHARRGSEHTTSLERVFSEVLCSSIKFLVSG